MGAPNALVRLGRTTDPESSDNGENQANGDGHDSVVGVLAQWRNSMDVHGGPFREREGHRFGW